ncbi:hypothetical protein [Neorhizobium galegae]|uniref:hypothetical protein n=1 Tax=Neorhizobium galegae TaxID=399 RepID=UPI00127378AE|nr:hypothetical protein [Neorhizobium galegae]KAA9386916.1 hypothetical protein F4V88_10760 [Neorhizobium galegae]MCM2499893.1 hypothetical protein [Neorhizobium galegae]
MAPPRKPLAQARLSGAIYKNPQRYRDRHEPLVSEPLGDPFPWLKPEEADAWEEFRIRLPWLNKSHRGITSIAACLQARMVADELGVPGQTLLLRVLGSMGATPASSRFAVVPEPETDDPAEKYFR